MKKESFPVLSGYVNISGFYFPNTVLSSKERSKRILSLYRKGCGLYKYDCGYVLILPDIIHINTLKSPAIPLVNTGTYYSQIIPGKSMIENLDLSVNSILLVIEGQIKVFTLSHEFSVDPSELINVSEYEFLNDCVTFGKLPDPPVMIVNTVKKDVKAILGEASPEPTMEQKQMISDIKEMIEKGEIPVSGGEKVVRKSLGLLGGLFGMLFSSKNISNRIDDGNGNYQIHSNGFDLKSKIMSKLMKNPLLWRFLAGKHSKYLKNMIDMFEKGDLSNALRHGISLSNAMDLSSKIGPWSMGPRKDLSFTRASSGGGSAGVGEDTFEYLKKLYEKAFNKLDREGKFEEAAFVLAELISDSERAVSYLEGKEKLKEAAELAESKELSPGIVIRQWFLCGELEKAISIAKKTGAFSEAVLHLERTHKNKAKALRILWAKYLEGSGEFNEAIDVIWPVEDARDLALEWIEKSIDTGGVAGALMLAKRLSLVDDKRDDTKKKIFKLLKSMDAEDFNAKSAFAKEFCSIEENEYTKVIGRHTFKTVLRERVNGVNHLNKNDLNNLVAKSNDQVLFEDYKNLDLSFFSKSKNENIFFREDPLIHTFSKKGVVKIFDICLLHRGRFLVALGEAGVKIVNSKLKTIAHFNVPAHALVISDNRNRAIVLGKRGEVFRISRISINERKCNFWYETAISQFAKTFNGGYWFVVSDYERVSAIDVQSDSFRAIWNVKNIGVIANITRSEHNLSLFTTGNATEKFVYETDGGITLRERKTINTEPTAFTSISPAGSLSSFYYQEENLNLICEMKIAGGVDVLKEIEYYDGLSGFPVFLGDFLAVPVKTDYGSDIVVFSTKTTNATKIVMVIKLEMCDEPKLRLYENKLLIADNYGRIIVMDLAFGEILYSLEV